MRKKNNMLMFAIVVVFGVFSFTLNTGFAESLQAGKGNIDKFKFSSPAAEENFIQYGQLDNDFSLETTVKDVLGSPGDSDFAPSPQRSTSCTTRCTTNCTRSCTTNCTGSCTANCTRSCTTYCRHYHSPVCE
tara:strand:+ start:22 stop:417 length:396 start_codon:yes stop_codon:yes gene_type:complete